LIEENLTEDEKNAFIKRLLTRTNPQAAHNISVYSFKDSVFKKNDDVTQLLVHFALNEDLLKNDSEEANMQQTTAELKYSVEERQIKEQNEGITYDKTEGVVEDAAAEQKKSLRNQFNFSDRSAVVYANQIKTMGGKTKPPPPQESNDEVTRADIFDAFIKAHEMEQAKKLEEEKKGAEKPEAAAEKKRPLQEDIMHSAELKKSLKIMERVMIQNFYSPIYVDYKYWVDEADNQHITVLPLWRIYYYKTNKKQVTSICWNPRYRDLFAVGYGSYEFQKNTSNGAICVFTLKNPSFPEYYFETPSEVMCLEFHPQHSALLAVGLYNGTVMVFDIRIKGLKNNPIYQSTVRTKKHTDPVWEVHWNKKEANRELAFFSISSDGRITKWTLMKNKLEPEDIIRLKMVAPPAQKGETRVDLDEEMALSGYAGGMCFSFNKNNDHLFLVGTEEGRIHLCSIDYSGDYLRTYQGHYLAVYAVRWNTYHPDVFLSCSADWTIKLWTKNRETPIATFELPASVSDVQWAPYSSTSNFLILLTYL
jgi:dynein intermediate chain 1